VKLGERGMMRNFPSKKGTVSEGGGKVRVKKCRGKTVRGATLLHKNGIKEGHQGQVKMGGSGAVGVDRTRGRRPTSEGSG